MCVCCGERERERERERLVVEKTFNNRNSSVKRINATVLFLARKSLTPVVNLLLSIRIEGKFGNQDPRVIVLFQVVANSETASGKWFFIKFHCNLLDRPLA